MTSRAIIIFIKNPILGKVKTRLAATIGDEQALDVYKQLLSKTHQITSPLNGNKYLYYSDFIEEDDGWGNDLFIKKQQRGNDLGEKMHHAFKEVFQQNKQVIIIGSDCFDLTTNHIEEAFLQLEKNEVVIGPANDGGYYLLGLNKPNNALFSEIEWSTENVLSATIKKIEDQKLAYHLLSELTDVDNIDDLKATMLLSEGITF